MWLKRGLLFVLAVGLLGASGVQGLLDRVIEFYSKKTGVVAEFEQVVRVKSPRRTMRRRGKVYFKRGGLMRWDYEWPSKVYYLSDGRWFWMYDVEEGSVYRMSLGKSPLYAVLGLLFDMNRVYQTFDVQKVKSKGEGYTRVRLVPKAKDAPLKEAYVIFESLTGKVVRVEIVDNVGTVSEISFKTQVQKDLPDNVFRLDIPKGLTVQDLDKVNSGKQEKADEQGNKRGKGSGL